MAFRWMHALFRISLQDHIRPIRERIPRGLYTLGGNIRITRGLCDDFRDDKDDLCDEFDIQYSQYFPIGRSRRIEIFSKSSRLDVVSSHLFKINRDVFFEKFTGGSVLLNGELPPKKSTTVKRPAVIDLVTSEKDGVLSVKRAVIIKSSPTEGGSYSITARVWNKSIQIDRNLL